MRQEIIDLHNLLLSGSYDTEIEHKNYDNLLEKFILNYDETLLPLMKKLIALDKKFWYA